MEQTTLTPATSFLMLRSNHQLQLNSREIPSITMILTALDQEKLTKEENHLEKLTRLMILAEQGLFGDTKLEHETILSIKCATEM